VTELVFDGELSRAETERVAAGSDFGRMVRRMPRAVLYPRTAADVVKGLELARREGLRVSARGQGHCTRGQAQVDDGLVIDMRHLDSIEIAAGSVRVGAGCLWSRLLARACETGQMPPTLTDYLELSVGGTLSVGGVGGQAFRFGMQTDNVEALTVVTGSGDVVECSASRNAKLFNACRGGLGQCGIIISAQLKLMPAPERVRVYNLCYPDARSFLVDQVALIEDGRFDYVLGNVLPEANGWAFSLEAVKYLPSPAESNEGELLRGLSFVPGKVEFREQSFLAYANRLRDIVDQLKGAESGRAFHPWMDLFVAADSVSQLLDAALIEFSPQQLTNGYVMTYPLVRAACSTPFLQLPGQRYCFLFDVLPHISAQHTADLTRFEASCARLYQLGRRLGVSVYPIGYPVGAMSEADWKAQLGAAWGELSAAKAEFDPQSLLGAGVRVF
jgi:FAD/FMN-containing dehydrogenase